MKQLFDPEAIRAQITNLVEDRDRIDQAISALRAALRNVDGLSGDQSEFSIDLKASDTTLHDAVRNACLNLKDGITRQRVIAEIEREHPFLKPKSPSVAASLINLTKGEHPMLNVAIGGKGRSPAFYSIYNNTVHQLSADEIRDLLDPATTKGTGGWQSLFASLQKNFEKAHGNLTLTANQRAKIFHYYKAYGGGGWQERCRRIFAGSCLTCLWHNPTKHQRSEKYVLGLDMLRNASEDDDCGTPV